MGSRDQEVMDSGDQEVMGSGTRAGGAGVAQGSRTSPPSSWPHKTGSLGSRETGRGLLLPWRGGGRGWGGRRRGHERG